MFTNISVIFVLLFFNPGKQFDMMSRNENTPAENNEPLKVVLNMPDEILQGQPCEIKVDIKNISDSAILVNRRLSVGYRNSLSRELYITICNQDSSVDVGMQKVLYERNFASPSDFIWLLPQQKTSTHFNLFDWYEIPSAGTYTLRVCYQADEDLAYKPDGLCKGVFCSEEKKMTVSSE